ncbi:hypothetical protein T484DRAFT_2253033 [Baffinella frigidus]|nr:hypothetical protein T484DRAFT_2253033 [Cryptophyta sp. CCMP2293]
MTASRSDDNVVHIPNDSVGLIIGRSGATIRELEAQTGVKIHIAKECERGSNTRAITIQAESKSAIEVGKRAVLAKAAEHKPHLGGGARSMGQQQQPYGQQQQGAGWNPYAAYGGAYPGYSNAYPGSYGAYGQWQGQGAQQPAYGGQSPYGGQAPAGYGQGPAPAPAPAASSYPPSSYPPQGGGAAFAGGAAPGGYSYATEQTQQHQQAATYQYKAQ